MYTTKFDIFSEQTMAFGSLSYSDEWGMSYPKRRYPTGHHHCCNCCNEALQNDMANPDRGCAKFHLAEFHYSARQQVQGQGLSFFFFFFGVPVCVFLLGMSKSWHPEGTCGLSQRAKINKTSALSSQILNLMRSSRGMCGRNMSKRIVWGSLCGIGINDKVT